MKQKLITKKILILATFIFIKFGFSQETYIPIQKEIVPPSVQEFVKYENTSVNYSSGTPNITVPIYTIVQDGVSIPLSLQYLAKGYKVDEEASWVGLGWSFNLASIYQQINDKDDLDRYLDPTHYSDYLLPHPGNSGPLPIELKYNSLAWSGVEYGSSYLTTGNTVNDQIHQFTSTGSDVPLDGTIYSVQGYISSPTPMHPILDIFEPRGYGYVDTEPDYFTINLFGKTIQVVYDFDTDEFVILNNKLYEISFDSTTSSFVISSPDEVDYYFEIKKKITNYSSSDSFDRPTGATSTSHTNQWLLTKIITPKASEILFNYDYLGYEHGVSNIDSSENTNLIGFKRSEMYSYFDVSGSNPSEAGGEQLNVAASVSPYVILPHNGINETLYKVNRDIYYLTSIEFEKGTIHLERTSRDDISTYYDPTLFSKLSNISLKDSNSSTITSYSFSYDYFSSSNSGNNWRTPLPEDLKRLRLNSISKDGQLYREFVYNSTVLPPKTSYATDYWGYYNGALNNTSYVPNPSRFINAGIVSNTNFNFIVNSNNHSAHETYSRAGVLEEIILPTGGKEAFEYELNSYDSNGNNKVPNYNNSNDLVEGNGLRVKTQKLFDTNGAPVFKKEYTYNGGVLPVRLQFFKNFTAMYRYESGSNIIKKTYQGYQVRQNNLLTPPNLNELTDVSYSGVTENIIDVTNPLNSFKTEFLFTTNSHNYFTMTPANSGYHYEFYSPALPSRSELKNGVLLSSKYYNNNDELVKQMEYTYFIKESPLFYGVRTQNIAVHSVWLTDFGGAPGQLMQVPKRSISFYPIYYDSHLLKSKTTTEFIDNMASTLVEELTYDNYWRLNKKTNSNQKLGAGEKLVTTYTYPNPQDPSSYLLTHPIEIETTDYITMDLSNVEQKKTYNYQQDQVSTAGGLLDLYTLDYSWDCPRGLTTGILQDDCIQTTFNKYDTNGNVLEYQVGNNQPVTLIWGYNYSHVIAKIENATYTDIQSYEPNLHLLSNNDFDRTLNYNGNEGALRQALDNLRLDVSLTNTFITTYTYDPLIGITSITDPKGNTVYYEYDEFNRLKHIIDKSGNILSQNEYHYATQN